MDLTSSKTIKELLEKRGARPSKGLGQNFLIDKNVLQKIIKAAELKPDESILEVGPGIGTLTQELAKNCGQVIAVEKDKLMVEILKETLAEFKNVEIIQGDALKIFNNFPNLKNYKLIANIPYYITSPLIRVFLEAENKPQEIVLMIQKEVAQRICPACRQTGSNPPKMNLLAVSVQFYAEPKIISYVSKNCFWPAPKVDSAIIKIIPHLGGLPMSAEQFFKIVKAGFSQPRKQLANNLSLGLKISKKEAEQLLLQNNIKPSQRAETLSIQDWKNLAESCE